MLPSYNPEKIFDVKVAEDGFIDEPAYNISPTITNQPGIFATGTAIGPMDIVDSIMTAGAAAAEAASYINKFNGDQTKKSHSEPESKVKRSEVYA